MLLRIILLSCFFGTGSFRMMCLACFVSSDSRIVDISVNTAHMTELKTHKECAFRCRGIISHVHLTTRQEYSF
ncbi:hypothetical protein IWW34DRAFT_744873 [Fusarium oxysporum f. sp. albedinis]|nr:hypothetical protein IWW34DRAFT_744873 [Fusarium oxysporum f. sp. albedinis]KAJ0133665.1 Uncharacterized protein HZ326_23283 [Fusarium oxysporum f. sp. albedinis]